MNIDFQILDAIQGIRTPLCDTIMPYITMLGDNGILWILLALVLLIIPKTRKIGAVLAVSLVLDVLLCNVILKPLVARIRPFEINTAVELLVDKPTDFSFPSGHAAASFTSAFALLFSGHIKSGVAAMVVACLIAFSRLYLYVHYPTDILGGLIIGIICGYLGNKLVEFINKLIKQRSDAKA